MRVLARSESRDRECVVLGDNDAVLPHGHWVAPKDLRGRLDAV